MPSEVKILSSNANGAITYFQNRIYLAFRTSTFHFANNETRIYIVSSKTDKIIWEHEKTIYLKTDMREPEFFEFNNNLQFVFFEAGTNPIAFEPKRLLRITRLAFNRWTEPE